MLLLLVASSTGKECHFGFCGVKILLPSLGPVYTHSGKVFQFSDYWVWVVLAMSPNSWVGSSSGSTRNQTLATGLSTWKTGHIGNRPVLPPKTRHFTITTLPTIKYLSSDRIVTWSVLWLCNSSRTSTSRYQICDPTNIRWGSIENLLTSFNIWPFFTTTQRISVGSQIRKRDVKERSELHNVPTDHVTIWWELQYLIAAKGVGTVKLQLRSGSNPAEILRVYVRSRYHPHQDQMGRVFGQVSNRTEPNGWPKTGPLAR